ncbi:MAG: lytic transglycosylase domain-containing protein [Calothrix sp. SM1_5_4]|nr:lytic transglycosylase domain-containing protein [Calothrix sp. SM1_5_4]
MQILPSTAKWMAAQAGLGPEFNLEDPAVNIRIGTTYFAQLRKSFGGKGTRYVAAYNMGPGNVRRLIASNTEPRIYPDKVVSNYMRFYKALDNVISRSTAAGRAIASSDMLF